MINSNKNKVLLVDLQHLGRRRHTYICVQLEAKQKVGSKNSHSFKTKYSWVLNLKFH